jgi:hypothetical protein
MDQQTGFVCGLSYNQILLNAEFLYCLQLKILQIAVIIVLFSFGDKLLPFIDVKFFGGCKIIICL